VAGGIGGALLLVVGLVFALKPGKEPPPAEPPPALAPAPKPEAPEKPLSPEEAAWESAKGEPDRKALADLRSSESKGSTESSKAAYEFFLGKGRKDLGLRVVRARLEADGGDAWARGVLGHADLRPALEEIAAKRADLDGDPIPEWESVRKRLDEGRTWVEEGAEKRTVEAEIAAVKAHLAEISDPWRKEMKAVSRAIRAAPAFEKYSPIDERAIPPYLVLAQVQQDPMKHSTKNVLDNHAKFFQCLTGEFLRIMGEAGLPTPTVEELGNPVLKAFVFIDRGNFDQWHRDQGWPPNALKGVRAYYSWGGSQFMMMYDTGAPTGTQDEDTCTAFHEATHQLVHYYKRYYRTLEDRKKDPQAPEVSLVDPRLGADPHWFQEGFAEFFGGADRISSQTGEWKLFRPYKSRLREWGDPFLRKAPQWTLDEVVRMPDKEQLGVLAEKKWPGHREEMNSLYYAQAWTLNHFLYFGKNGRYREKYLRIVNDEMRSEGGYEVFMKHMEAGEGEDRADFLAVMEKQWKEYAAELVRR
jgi:hypothetical protein